MEEKADSKFLKIYKIEISLELKKYGGCLSRNTTASLTDVKHDLRNDTMLLRSSFIKVKVF